jgi:geranylgeranyl diphosphate synthase type II
VPDLAATRIAAFETFARRERPRVERALKAALPRIASHPREIHQAMHYMVFPGGKRLRPLMVVLAHESLGGRHPGVRRAAAAMELIHTFSLIHDDLPCMDDDDYRRGRPSCHRAFGEATAVLAGDALLVVAFQVLAEVARGAEAAAILAPIARAIGTRGVIGGQSLDLASEGKRVPERTLRTIHQRKTGELFRACTELGARLAGASPRAVARAGRFGMAFGLAFQVADDLLNLEGDFRKLGRPAGTDLAHRKATYPRLLGREATYRIFRRLVARALRAAREWPGRREAWEGLVLKAARRVPGWGPEMEKGLL